MMSATSQLHVIVPGQVMTPAIDLTDAELRRADAFRFPMDRSRWIACRAALRRVLAPLCEVAPKEVPLLVSPNGKPLLAPPFDSIHFNLSHSDDLGLIAVDSVPVGIDVEPISRAQSLLDCAASFCHPDEIAGLADHPKAQALQLLSIWTAKEAVLKALGTGLLQPPEQVFIDHAHGTAFSDRPVPGLGEIRFEKLNGPAFASHSAFLARLES